MWTLSQTADKKLMHLKEKSEGKSVDQCWLMDSGKTGVIMTSINYKRKWS